MISFQTGLPKSKPGKTAVNQEPSPIPTPLTDVRNVPAYSFAIADDRQVVIPSRVGVDNAATAQSTPESSSFVGSELESTSIPATRQSLTAAPVNIEAAASVQDVAAEAIAVGSVPNSAPSANNAPVPEGVESDEGRSLADLVQSGKDLLFMQDPLGNRQVPREPTAGTTGPVTSNDTAETMAASHGAKTKPKKIYFKYAPKRFDEWNLFGKEFAGQQGRRLTIEEVLAAYSALSETDKLCWTEMRSTLESSAPAAGKNGARNRK
ncbi:hypothetical protein CVT24_012445 [Panaeolus cyanescens]|uniref:Uncharacterized protein n=1 Tax=Panaeolus cyanescens TaxID=181874 RepID=A0A409YJ70_9AGAR|nr:hypothetical protein CVT24_012445 [Panaeolus cyanescens]